MTRSSLIPLLAGLVLATVFTPVAAVLTPSGIDPRLRLDWEAGQGRGGQPVITGYIYNDYGRAAINVRLLAETLDASGQVIGRAVGFVPGNVPVSNRSYFSVPLKTTGPAYRLTVTHFEWRDSGF